jgi:DNA-binding NtrC family response regulator
VNRSESGDQPPSVPSAEASTTRDISRSPEHVTLRRFRLVVVSGVDQGKELVSTDEKTIVGSAEGCNLQLSDPTVSRFHTEISVSSGRATIRDLGSRNGTIVEGVTVLGAVLRHGAKVVLGETTIRFEDRSDEVKVDLSEDACFGSLVGKSAAMRRVFLLLERASKSDAVVLITGETGTGKELAAESIHAASARRAGPFVTVDCSALPENLVESELFGHERGAFTGATESRAGAFEASHGGTLFLDEIGELPAELQPKLLRVLEKREVKRVGSNKWQRVDVRVIAATNRDLRAEVNAKRFRSDLFFRLAVVEVEMPPLRERTDDLPVLLDRLAASLTGLPEGRGWRDYVSEADLARHAWPGNVRELRNHLERCLVLVEPAPLHTVEAASAGMKPDVSRPLKVERKRFLDAFERAYLEAVLAREGGNVTKAARAAGVDRMHFYRLLWRAGLK